MCKEQLQQPLNIPQLLCDVQRATDPAWIRAVLPATREERQLILMVPLNLRSGRPTQIKKKVLIVQQKYEMAVDIDCRCLFAPDIWGQRAKEGFNEGLMICSPQPDSAICPCCGKSNDDAFVTSKDAGHGV